MLVSLMGGSILCEVPETPSILRTELSSASAILDYRSLDSCPRTAGWSAATLCVDPTATLASISYRRVEAGFSP